MASLTLDAKKALVADMNQVFSGSLSAALAEYNGLTVSEMTALRTKARENSVYVRVVPNNLARRAADGTAFACLQDAFVGPLVLMLSQEDPGAAARLVRDFAKDHEALKITALALDGQLMGPEQLKAVASLPTRDEALAQLLSVMQAPVRKLAQTLQETYAQMVRVVAAVGEAK